MDVDEVVWAAYLSLVEEQGGRLTRDQRQALSRHRGLVQAAARLSVALDTGDDLWTQLSLFGE